ncbi:MAG: hypothetical protein WC712_12985 [Candidatus Brocadiia bacterium]
MRTQRVSLLVLAALLLVGLGFCIGSARREGLPDRSGSGSGPPEAPLRLNSIMEKSTEISSAEVTIADGFEIDQNAVVSIIARKIVLDCWKIPLAGKLILRGKGDNAVLVFRKSLNLEYPIYRRFLRDTSVQGPLLSSLIISGLRVSGDGVDALFDDTMGCLLWFNDCVLDLSGLSFTTYVRASGNMSNCRVLLDKALCVGLDGGVIQNCTFTGSAVGFNISNSQIENSYFDSIAQLEINDSSAKQCRLTVDRLFCGYGIVRISASRMKADSVEVSEAAKFESGGSVIEVGKWYWGSTAEVSMGGSLLILGDLPSFAEAPRGSIRSSLLLDRDLASRSGPQSLDISSKCLVLDQAFIEATVTYVDKKADVRYRDLHQDASELRTLRSSFEYVAGSGSLSLVQKDPLAYSMEKHKSLLDFARNVVSLDRFHTISYWLLRGDVPE